jgi:hypothetical protein
METLNSRILMAAAPPSDDAISKRPMSLRIEVPYFESLESMAKLLGKSPSGLANELLEAMIEEFSTKILKSLRPDLMLNYRGRWLTPKEAPSYRKPEAIPDMVQSGAVLKEAEVPDQVDIIPANYQEGDL